jgi:hypothetical protein
MAQLGTTKDGLPVYGPSLEHQRVEPAPKYTWTECGYRWNGEGWEWFVRTVGPS